MYSLVSLNPIYRFKHVSINKYGAKAYAAYTNHLLSFVLSYLYINIVQNMAEINDKIFEINILLISSKRFNIY